MTRLFYFIRAAGGCGIAAWAMLAGGCASPPDHVAGQPMPSAVVDMHLHSFDPKTVTITVGQAVLWKNTTPIVYHTVTADPALAEDSANVELPRGVASFDSGKIPSGGVYERIFTVPGTYRYICQPHESHGMIGTVIVKPGEP